jgi:hydroxymethylpyrimidine/phosphomethylpyrimidine kinase
MRGRVLIIAGSDSGGGAGIQADIKTVTALGGYAMTAITAVTVQNTEGVFDVHPIPIEILEGQARVVLEDLGADVIKTGMLGSVETVEAVARVLDGAPGVPAVIDPVMTAKGGQRLLDGSAEASVRDLLVPRAALLTPNAPEAEALTGLAVRDEAELRRAGEALLERGAKAVLMKGGHLPGDLVVDLLLSAGVARRYESKRVQTRHTHGTGCTLASACAVGLAQGMKLEEAVGVAHAYTAEAIRRAPGFGRGHGPLDHAWTVRERG